VISHIAAGRQGGYFEYKPVYISTVPIRQIDPSNYEDIKKRNKIENLVEHILDLHKRIPATPQEQEQLQRQIAATDRQIDQLVYQLYGLTEEEIRIVEGQ
jgi:tRNA(Ile)-lysidine synthase TilS/MesJ